FHPTRSTEKKEDDSPSRPTNCILGRSARKTLNRKRRRLKTVRRGSFLPLLQDLVAFAQPRLDLDHLAVGTTGHHFLLCVLTVLCMQPDLASGHAGNRQQQDAIG